MIIYELACLDGHRFEGWFSTASACDDDLAQGKIDCPVCGQQNVHRVPMSHISAPKTQHTSTAHHKPDANNALNTLNNQDIVDLLLAYVVKNTENVGHKFADLARDMHYNKTPERAIRGQSTVEEAHALKEEGIDIMPLPNLRDPKKLN